MKNNHFLQFTLLLAAFALPIQISEAQPLSQTSAVTSASKTSFAEVTAQLDPGGNFFLYLGTAQWLEQLSGKVAGWRQKFAAMPNVKSNDVMNINKAFDIVGRLIQDSGVESVTGLGMSSIEIEKGMYRNKAFLHHYAGKDDGFIWKLCGGPPHPLTGLDLCPANTALAIFADAELPLLWNVAKAEVAQSGFPQANDFLQQLPDQFEKKTNVKWDAFLNSLGGEFGLIITLDQSNNVPIPLPTGLIQIPAPGLLLVIKVNDDTIFNRLEVELKKQPTLISVETNGVSMRTLPVPIPLPFSLRPTAATGGGYLFIASSDALVQAALAVKSGGQPGLKSTAEFKRLAQGIPEQGNQFSFMSASFGRALAAIQQQIMTAQSRQNASTAQLEWFKSLLHSDRAAFAYSVGMNTPDGCLTVGNGNQSAAALVLLPALAVPGMMAAIAIPNFVKARATSQQNACINNLRQLDAAKNQWALEKVKKTGDAPTKEDLLPYLRKWPTCPQGGTYTIGPVGEAPTCSIPGHKLPQ